MKPPMSPTVLNRRIRKLGENHHSYSQIDLKKEFMELYNEDPRFERMNKLSVLIMLRLNLSYRFLQLHQFGILINISGILHK